jgi:hypothetical protein
VQMSLETNIYLSDTNQRKLILLMTVWTSDDIWPSINVLR